MQESPQARTRVFIVEDEAVIAMDLRERLESIGYEVCGLAAQGEKAVPAIVEVRPDLVLMDIHLAGPMDGVEAARQLSELHPAPVVFLTAYADAQIVARVAEVSAYGYLVKPFEERELHATLQVALARASAHAQLDAAVDARTQELQVALRDMESFSYCIAHDLRAPLRAMSGYATLIAQRHAETLPPDAVQMLGKVDLAARRMSLLIDGLLEFSRLGKQPLHRQTVNMHQLAEHAANELRPQDGARRVEVRIGEMPDLQGDPMLLDQVWRNLFANAFKFSATRDAARVDAGFDAARGAWFVRDNGVGFDMRHADKLFRPFARLHAADQFEGVGVGLAHSARIVQRHGGRLWADASPDRGATFYLEIPACPA
ncbi:MAG: response regulator [Rubrivivax sp.]|nr:response regulator [Rubrivivax sp.]